MDGGRIVGSRSASAPGGDAEDLLLVSKAHGRPRQRERLIQAMIELSSERGYREVTVAGVSAHAGVSSATFYEQFANKEDCLAAAYQASAARVLGEMVGATSKARVISTSAPGALREALQKLMAGIEREPNAASVLFIEGLAGAPRLREESLRVLGLVEARAEAVMAWASPEEGPIDLPASALAGAVRGVVSRRLRGRREDRLPGLVEPLLQWILSYQLPAGHPRWTTSSSASVPGETRIVPGARQSQRFTRTRLPRGRHGLSASEVIRSQRTRIIAATAEVTMRKGYASTTVADIVTSAGVAKDAFYEHFNDKEHAFLEAQQHPTQYILDRCAEAYFRSASWPERLWNHLETLVRMVVENPTISHLRLVECYAAGPAAVRQAEEITRAFNIFVEEGYVYSAVRRPHVFSEAITGAIFEVIRRHTARGESSRLLDLLPQLTYLGLAPFVGAAEAVELIDAIARNPATANA